ncbi:MAG: FAD-dependent oxidoreductase, partial [Alphaproteobacteria bacterium]|nr:FAD-dependent oxidoreductase [Alphaproteobacteria bacterium]
MTTKRVLILGAGFGGAFVARDLARLRRPDIEIEIVDEDNHFVFQPLLPEVAGGSVNAADAVTPLRLLLPGALTSQGVVAGIDFARREVEIVQGARGEQLRRARWDHLVLALGLETDLSRFPGLAGHAMTMRDLSDA